MHLIVDPTTITLGTDPELMGWGCELHWNPSSIHWSDCVSLINFCFNLIDHDCVSWRLLECHLMVGFDFYLEFD